MSRETRHHSELLLSVYPPMFLRAAAGLSRRLRRERCKGMPLRQCIERAEAMELATPGPGDGGVPNIG